MNTCPACLVAQKRSPPLPQLLNRCALGSNDGNAVHTKMPVDTCRTHTQTLQAHSFGLLAAGSILTNANFISLKAHRHIPRAAANQLQMTWVVEETVSSCSRPAAPAPGQRHVPDGPQGKRPQACTFVMSLMEMSMKDTVNDKLLEKNTSGRRVVIHVSRIQTGALGSVGRAAGCRLTPGDSTWCPQYAPRGSGTHITAEPLGPSPDPPAQPAQAPVTGGHPDACPQEGAGGGTLAAGAPCGSSAGQQHQGPTGQAHSQPHLSWAHQAGLLALPRSHLLLKLPFLDEHAREGFCLLAARKQEKDGYKILSPRLSLPKGKAHPRLSRVK